MIRVRPLKKPATSAQSSMRDVWDKADVVAKFLSSVVIAVVGILITYQVQRTQILTNQAIAEAQLKAAREKAADERQSQENLLTVQLLNHLISENGVQRRLAIVALRQSVPSQVYDPIAQILATSDRDPAVRASAISQLATGNSPEISVTLNAIANDAARTRAERTLAAQSSANATWGTSNSVPTLVFMASSPGEALPITNPFSSVIAEAFSPNSGVSDISSLASYINSQVASMSGGKQNPLYKLSGPPPTRDASSLPAAEAKAIVIASSGGKTKDFPRLPGVGRDAQRVAEAFRSRGIEVTLLLDQSKGEILRTLGDLAGIASRRPLIVYYGGGAATSPVGSGWIVKDSDSDPKTWLLYEDVKIAIARSGASANWLFFDSMFADAAFPTPR